MTTQVIEGSLDTTENNSTTIATICRTVASLTLYLAALIAGWQLWSLTFHVVAMPAATGPYADWMALVVRESRLLLIGCHVIPYALSTSGRLVMGDLSPSTRKIEIGIMVVALVSLICATVTLGIR